MCVRKISGFLTILAIMLVLAACSNDLSEAVPTEEAVSEVKKDASTAVVFDHELDDYKPQKDKYNF